MSPKLSDFLTKIIIAYFTFFVNLPSHKRLFVLRDLGTALSHSEVQPGPVSAGHHFSTPVFFDTMKSNRTRGLGTDPTAWMQDSENFFAS